MSPGPCGLGGMLIWESWSLSEKVKWRILNAYMIWTCHIQSSENYSLQWTVLLSNKVRPQRNNVLALQDILQEYRGTANNKVRFHDMK